jgi:hypothetical protein
MSEVVEVDPLHALRMQPDRIEDRRVQMEPEFGRGYEEANGEEREPEVGIAMPKYERPVMA